LPTDCTMPLLFDEPVPDMLWFERRLRAAGVEYIAGIDEAGRGPLAGPVVAAAVVLPPDCDLPGVTDSKKLSARRREQLFVPIRRQALAVGVGIVNAAQIDRLNILQATLVAMTQALERLKVTPGHLLVDGITPVPVSIAQQTIKQGDSRSLSIASASIIAKVVRDRMMLVYDKRYPQYGFAAHKGYGTAAHRQAIAACGPCELHRKTFAGVREYL